MGSRLKFVHIQLAITQFSAAHGVCPNQGGIEVGIHEFCLVLFMNLLPQKVLYLFAISVPRYFSSAHTNATVWCVSCVIDPVKYSELGKTLFLVWA